MSWLNGEDEDDEVMTDDELIADVLENDKTDDEITLNFAPQKCTVCCDEALKASNTCLKWAEEQILKRRTIFF